MSQAQKKIALQETVTVGDVTSHMVITKMDAFSASIDLGQVCPVSFKSMDCLLEKLSSLHDQFGRLQFSGVSPQLLTMASIMGIASLFMNSDTDDRHAYSTLAA